MAGKASSAGRFPGAQAACDAEAGHDILASCPSPSFPTMGQIMRAHAGGSGPEEMSAGIRPCCDGLSCDGLSWDGPAVLLLAGGWPP